MQRPEYHTIVKYFKAQASQEEEALVRGWANSAKANRQELDRLLAIWHTYGKHHETYSPDQPVGYQKVLGRIFPYAGWAQSIAASVVLLVLAGITFYHLGSSSAKEIAYSAHHDGLEVKLPDGSLVVLRAGAKIELNKDFNKEGRELELSGEAFFDVAKDEEKPFVIQTQELTIEVLGTSFLVTPAPDRTEVVLYTGLLRVSAENQQLQLHPSQKAIFDGQLRKASSLDANALSWRTREFTFRNEPLDRVFETLMRHYRVIIESSEPIKPKRLTASFRDQSIEEVLQAIAEVHGLQIITKSKNHFYISSK